MNDKKDVDVRKRKKEVTRDGWSSVLELFFVKKGELANQQVSFLFLW